MEKREKPFSSLEDIRQTVGAGKLSRVDDRGEDVGTEPLDPLRRRPPPRMLATEEVKSCFLPPPPLLLPPTWALVN